MTHGVGHGDLRDVSFLRLWESEAMTAALMRRSLIDIKPPAAECFRSAASCFNLKISL
jgi:hypothetical protein